MKILLLGIVIGSLSVCKVLARPVLIDEKDCPKNVVCNSDQIMGDDGVCYSCDSGERIHIQCIGWKKVKEICPNRLFSHPTVWSYLTCPKNFVEVPEYKGYCLHKCKEGFEGSTEFGCKNTKTGEFYQWAP